MPVIGVTGHRALAEVEKVEAGVDRAFERIEQAFPEGPIVVLSGLAEGADRLVVRRALERPRFGTLVGFYPLFRDGKTYEDTFSSRAAIEEYHVLRQRAAVMLPVVPPGDEPDENVWGQINEQILFRAQVLLAVWDGHTAGSPGGTGTMVARARGCALPIAWVHAGNRRPGTMEATSLGEEQGAVTLERFCVPGVP